MCDPSLGYQSSLMTIERDARLADGATVPVAHAPICHPGGAADSLHVTDFPLCAVL
jgi:hypothetical protein